MKAFFLLFPQTLNPKPYAVNGVDISMEELVQNFPGRKLIEMEVKECSSNVQMKTSEVVESNNKHNKNVYGDESFMHELCLCLLPA